jgi:hypothetical protein
MKLFLFALSILLLTFCTVQKKNIKSIPIKNDTIVNGKIGEPNSYLEVHSKRGDIEIFWFSKQWNEKGRLEERYHNFDSKGRDSAGVFCIYYSNGYLKSYVWSDTVRTYEGNDPASTQRILMIDSLFSINGKVLKEVKYSFHTDNKIHQAKLLPEIEVRLFYKNNRINKKWIWKHIEEMIFVENGGNYYSIDTSIPREYVEADEISKGYFGEAMRDALIAKRISVEKAKQRDPKVMCHIIDF